MMGSFSVRNAEKLHTEESVGALLPQAKSAVL
jgi:hypothetical protein